MSSITEMLPCIDSCFMFSLDFASILVETNSGRLQLGGKNWALCICIACDGHTKLCVCTMHSKRQKYFKVTNGKSATDDDHKRWYRLWCSFLGAEVWCQCVRDLYIYIYVTEISPTKLGIYPHRALWSDTFSDFLVIPLDKIIFLQGVVSPEPLVWVVLQQDPSRLNTKY